MRIRITIVYDPDWTTPPSEKQTLENEIKAWRDLDVNVNDIEDIAKHDPELNYVIWETI